MIQSGSATDIDFSENSDVYLGYLGWSAGSFDSTYSKLASPGINHRKLTTRKVLTETPTGSGSNMVDTALVKACLAR